MRLTMQTPSAVSSVRAPRHTCHSDTATLVLRMRGVPGWVGDVDVLAGQERSPMSRVPHARTQPGLSHRCACTSCMHLLDPPQVEGIVAHATSYCYCQLSRGQLLGCYSFPASRPHRQP